MDAGNIDAIIYDRSPAAADEAQMPLGDRVLMSQEAPVRTAVVARVV